jgi:hypothetical protein
MRRDSALALGGLLALGLGLAGGEIPRELSDRGLGTPTSFRSSIPEFGPLLHLIRATIAHDRVEFRGRTGPIGGFAAGTSYPQIWLRDAATIIPASRLFYPAIYFQSWIEEHLAIQRADGSLADWIDFAGKSGKNTTETDQEASAVLAASQTARIVGTAWLEKPVGGVSILDRLEKSLRFVLENRFDRARGLVIGAHTADWGDVDSEDADERAITTGANTLWTCDIYDQAIFYGACLALAEMRESRGAPAKAAAWRDAARALRENADRALWLEDRGHYRVHIHRDRSKHGFDEDAMFPMGGNAEAILWGLASPDRAARIIETALARQVEYEMPAVSASLLPPYPKGFFKHPSLDEPFEYQNGGLWDWFGAKLVFGMFENGYSAAAREKLRELALKNIANKGLFEWDAPDGSGRGSPFYAGSAGSLAKALFEGYFGVKLSPENLEFAPRLGEDAVRLNVRVPASGIYAAYDYRWDAASATLSFRFESNVSGRGPVRIVLPAVPAPKDASVDEDRLEVKLDGRPVPFTLTKLHRDFIVSIETDFRPHLLTVAIL